MRNNIIKNIKIALFISSSFLLTACNGFFEKDNTPTPRALTKYTPEIQPQLIWSTRAGGGTDGEYLKMSPLIAGNAIYTTSTRGVVTSVNKTNGSKNWQVDTDLPLAAGPGVGDGIVVIGSRKGHVLALREIDGRTLWQTFVPGEILARPAVGNGVVIVKTVDGHVRALSVRNGQEQWLYQQTEPNLILRGASAPILRSNDAIVGFANGNLAKLGSNDGRLYWLQPIAIPQGAFAIQRMVDIDANPIVYDHRIYAATYQGRIASLEWSSGRVLWSQDISSYTGMIADSQAVYISDAKSHLWAFNAESGLVNWRQKDLEYRVVSGPASQGRYIVVGDGEGYLHWLDKQDGHLAGRISVGSGIYASPIAEDSVVYALTNKGYLLAYTLTRTN